MRYSYAYLGPTSKTYYRCKCGKAFTVIRGWNEDHRWFTDIKEVDAEIITAFFKDLQVP